MLKDIGHEGTCGVFLRQTHRFKVDRAVCDILLQPFFKCIFQFDVKFDILAVTFIVNFWLRNSAHTKNPGSICLKPQSLKLFVVVFQSFVVEWSISNWSLPISRRCSVESERNLDEKFMHENIQRYIMTSIPLQKSKSFCKKFRCDTMKTNNSKKVLKLTLTHIQHHVFVKVQENIIAQRVLTVIGYKGSGC